MSVKTQWVSDEVWAALDPKAGAIKRVDLRWPAAAVALLATVTATWLSGFFYPRVAWSDATGSGASANTQTRTISTDVVIKNNGWTDARVVGIGQNGPGLELVGQGGPPHIVTDTGRTVPFTLHPGQIATVSVTYKITDCAAVPSGAFTVAARITRPWGTQTVGIAIPTVPVPSAPNGTGDTDREWQRALADQACGLGS